MSEIKTLRYIDTIKKNHDQNKILQDRAIKMEMRRMYRKRMISNSVIFILAAVAIFALIRWCGL